MDKYIYIIIIIIQFVYLQPTISLHGFECVFDPPNPICINVTYLEFNSAFLEGEVILKGRLELGNGTEIEIKFEVLSATLGFIQNPLGIYRNGFTNATGTGNCPPFLSPGSHYCTTKCKCNDNQICVFSFLSPCQSKGGLKFCQLCDNIFCDNCEQTLCECSVVKLTPGGCPCFGALLSQKFTACIQPVLTISFAGQSNSRFEVLEPDTFTGTGVMHITSPIHDFYILLSNINQQFFPAKVDSFNTTVLVRQTGEFGISPFEPLQVIVNDLSKQGPSPINTYLILQTEFIFSDRSNGELFGPIQEKPGEPNKFVSLIQPLTTTAANSFTTVFTGKGAPCAEPSISSSPIQIDMVNLLSKQGSIKLTANTYKDIIVCRKDAQAKCSQ